MYNNDFKKGLLPILPGLEEYAKSVPQNKKKFSQRDIYNLRLLKGLSAANLYGLPVLTGYNPIKISRPIAFNEARATWKKGRSLKGYFIHFFIKDELFDCLRKHPKRYLKMLKSADFIIAPDYSTYRNYHFPVLLKNTYDNMLLAAYFEREGMNVVPNVVWSRPIFYDVTFSGQPVNSTICISSKSLNLRDSKGIKHWLHGYKEAIQRLNPKRVIRIGKIIPREERIYANPFRVEIINPYVNYMRYGR